MSIPWLEPAKTYAGFNGNKVLKGRGYRLMTDNGWLVRAGYRTDEIQPFLSDLAALAKPLGLVAVGIEHPTQTCHDLKQMQRLSFTLSGRRLLDKLHLRIYSEADYLQRWNQYFRWPAAAPETTQHDDVSVMALATAMTEHGISQRALAQNLQVDPAYLNKVLSGKKPAPQKLLQAAINWIGANAKPQTPVAHSSADSPLPQSSGILEQAFAYQARGWSILPQRPAEKKPYIRWRQFQERLPTPQEIQQWFQKWPDAGLAVILGPLSDLFVIDVDGPEAHAALVARLGAVPGAPKVLSGSGKPCRYHLFFRHPHQQTKAKCTPWHPKLEFRGDRGLVVLPPSLHASGHRYAWAAGASLDDLPLAPLPTLILQALRPTAASLPPAPMAAASTDIDAAASTRKFLEGRYADGPNWNDRLFRAACDLHARGVPLETAEPLLLQGAQPWNHGEAEAASRTIHSAYSQPREPSHR